MRMRSFTVHRRGRPGGESEFVFLNDGFAWGAALFSVFWALYHRLWWHALAFAGVIAVIVSADLLHAPAPEFRLAMELGFFGIAGFLGGDARRAALDRQGYREIAVVLGRSLLDAERRYFTLAAEPAR
jgi:Protein of unknown function (DUF2628)